MKNEGCLDELWKLFLKTGDPVYLNMYSIIRDRKKDRR